MKMIGEMGKTGSADVARRDAACRSKAQAHR